MHSVKCQQLSEKIVYIKKFFTKLLILSYGGRYFKVNPLKNLISYDKIQKEKRKIKVKKHVFKKTRNARI
jgi:hypothetical protein